MRPVLGAHVQNWNNDALSLALEAGGVVKTMSASPEPIVAILTKWPDTIVVGRKYFDLDEQQRFINDGVDGGKRCANLVADYFAAIAVVCEERGTQLLIEAVNEPPLRPYDTAPAALAVFSQGFAEMAVRRNLRPVLLNLSVGQPEGLIDERRYIWGQLAPALYAARQYGGVVGLHAYGCPTMQTASEYYTLRYQVDRRLFWPEDLHDLPIFLGEVGIDAGILNPAPPPAAAGWRSFATPEQYADQLRWFRNELAKDPYIIGATPFTSGPEGTWADFSLDGVPELAEVFREQREAQTMFPVTVMLDNLHPTSPGQAITVRGTYAPAEAEGGVTVIVNLPMSDDESHAYAQDPFGFGRAVNGKFEQRILIPSMGLPHPISAAVKATFTGFLNGDYGGGEDAKAITISPSAVPEPQPEPQPSPTPASILPQYDPLFSLAGDLVNNATDAIDMTIGLRVQNLVKWRKGETPDPWQPQLR